MQTHHGVCHGGPVPRSLKRCGHEGLFTGPLRGGLLSMAAGSLRIGTGGQGLPRASGGSGPWLSGRPGVWDPRGQRTRPAPSSHLTTGPGSSRVGKTLVLSISGRSTRPV